MNGIIPFASLSNRLTILSKKVGALMDGAFL